MPARGTKTFTAPRWVDARPSCVPNYSFRDTITSTRSPSSSNRTVAVSPPNDLKSRPVGLAAVAALAYAVHLRLPFRRTADAFAPSLALVSAVTSIACLEAGCDYGIPTQLPWAVIFRSPAAVPGTPLGVPLHPTQLYASMVQFLLFVLLLWLLHRPHHDGEILGAWLFLGGLSGFLLTLLRGDGIVTTQLVSAVMVLGGGLLWLRRPQDAHAG